MTLLRCHLSVPCALLLVGCGDRLLYGEALDERMGQLPPPEAPAWQLRWLGEDGLVPSCDLLPVEDLNDEDIVFGEAFAPLPDVGVPTAWIDEDDFRYAVAFPALVDAARFDAAPEEELEEAELAGMWGLAQLAWLVVDGDSNAARDMLLLDVGAPAPDPRGDVVAYAAELVDATGRVEGQLVPLWEDDRQWVAEEGLVVVSLRALDDDFEPLWEVVGGRAFGGVSECR